MSTLAADRLEAVAERYFAAWADRDPDAIVALHTPDTMFWLHGGAAAVHGKAAVREEFANIFAMFPDFAADTRRVLYGTDHWVLDWALTATVASGDGTRRPISVDCVDIVTVDDDGLVVRKDTYIDGPQLLAALSG